MKKLFILVLVTLLTAGLLSLASAQTKKKKGGGFSSPAGAPAGWYDKSVALVVGVGKYGNGWSSLSEPRTDADRVANALSSQGFEVIKLVDGQATREAIMRQIETYIPAKVGKNGRFVFYYSGHGQTEVAARTGRPLGYIVPADGRMQGGADDWSSYISMDALRTQINNKVASKHVLVVFDSCFSGTALTKAGTLGGNVDYFLGQPAINVLTAGDAGQPTPDGVFSYDFVNAINGSADTNQDGYVTFAEVGSYLQSQIPAKVPALSPSFGWWDGTSQMVFAYGGATSATSPAAEAPPSPAAATSSYKPPDLSDYDTVAQAEQAKTNAAQAAKQAKVQAAQAAYAKVKGYKESPSYSKNAKKAVYQKFLSDYSDKSVNPWYDEVYGWWSAGDEPDDMVLIPGGTFRMGCVPGDTQCYDDESPRHTERVDSFYADVHEVTNAEYQECVASGSCTAIDEAECYKWNGEKWAKGGSLDATFKGANQPAVCVNWHQATDYCASKGKRLPTEAEFEYALRGGRDGDKFPWGDSDNPPSSYGNYADESGARKHNWTRNASNIFMGYDDGYAHTAPVCSFSRNPYGLCDISGNVWEWTSDGYSANYNAARGTDRRVLRGGSWSVNPVYVRASFRVGDLPSLRLANVGFRCFRDGS